MITTTIEGMTPAWMPLTLAIIPVTRVSRFMLQSVKACADAVIDPEQAPTLLRQPGEDEDHEEDHEHDERNDRHHNTKMASSNLDEDAPRQGMSSYAPTSEASVKMFAATSESPLLFELPNEEDGKVNDNDNDGVYQDPRRHVRMSTNISVSRRRQPHVCSFTATERSSHKFPQRDRSAD